VTVPHPLQPLDLDTQAVTRDSDGPDLLSQIEVCRRLGISDQTWMTWRKAGKTPEAITLPSGRRKWRVSDIDVMVGRPIERAGRRYFAAARRRVRHSPATLIGQSVAPQANPLAVKRVAR
jgi:predicted DNA-binding transcriptional regulator AlpA